MTEPDRKQRARTTTLVVDLKDLKQPWTAWSKDRQLTPSEALRRVLAQVLAVEAAHGGEVKRVEPTDGPRHRWRRVEIRLTDHEYGILSRIAAREGMSVPRWLIGVYRRHVFDEPQFGPDEMAVLSRSSQILLALSRDINTIAGRSREGSEGGTLTLAQIHYLTEMIRQHTQSVSAVLTANLKRWRR